MFVFKHGTKAGRKSRSVGQLTCTGTLFSEFQHNDTDNDSQRNHGKSSHDGTGLRVEGCKSSGKVVKSTHIIRRSILGKGRNCTHDSASNANQLLVHFHLEITNLIHNVLDSLAVITRTAITERPKISPEPSSVPLRKAHSNIAIDVLSIKRIPALVVLLLWC